MGSLRNKVLLGTLVVVTLIIICSVAVFYKKDAEMIQNNYGQNLYYRVAQTGKYFDDTMRSIYEVSVELTYDDTLVEKIGAYQQERSESRITALVALLKDYKNKNMEINSICLYLEDQSVIITSEEYPMYIENTELTAERLQLGNPVLIKEPFRKEGDVLSFVSNMADSGLDNVYIMVNVQERSVYYNYLDNLDGEGVEAIILADAEGKAVSAKGGASIRSAEPNEISISYRMPFSQYQIQMVVSANELLGQLQSLRAFVLTLSLIFIVVAFLIFYFTTKLIYQPLNRLTETVKEIGEGNLDKRYVVSTKDEIGTLGTNFNNMLDQLNALFQRLIKEERLKKDAELEALQYQITPHFMYNTLNSIKCYALIKGEQEVADLILCFSELLQAVVSKRGAFIRLAAEVSVLEKYVKLEQFRNGDVFRVSYQIAREAEGCYIPRLILQPFVENSLMHGFDMRASGNEIAVRAVVVGKRLEIRIRDNGIGMSAEAIEKLLNSPVRKVTGLSSIGITNVKERLQLYFGNDGNVLMEGGSRGVEVIIYMPALRNPEDVRKFDDTEDAYELPGNNS